MKQSSACKKATTSSSGSVARVRRAKRSDEANGKAHQAERRGQLTIPAVNAGKFSAAPRMGGLRVAGLCVHTELREPDAAGLARAFDEFLFQQLTDLFFGNVGHGGNDLEITQARINFNGSHGLTVCAPRGMSETYPMG